jgi:hypothetical protein
VRPAPDYDVKARITLAGLTSSLSVVDISVGGIGVLVTHALGTLQVGDEVELGISVRGGEPFLVRANIRHIGPPGFGICGLWFVDPSETAASAIRRCVSELLQRGQHF